MSTRSGRSLAEMPAVRASTCATAKANAAANAVVTIRFMAPTWPVASSGNAARLRASPLRACSEFVGLLEIEPQLLHAGAAMEIPARRLGGRRIGAVDLLFALPISLLVGQFLLGESIGCAEDDQHSSQRQRNHFAGLSHSEHNFLHG